MNEDRHLTEEDRYNIDYEFGRMLSRYKDYLLRPREFFIDKNLVLITTDIGVLTLFVKEKNKKGISITKFNYNFIK
jgi:hypothetical protein